MHISTCPYKIQNELLSGHLGLSFHLRAEQEDCVSLKVYVCVYVYMCVCAHMCMRWAVQTESFRWEEPLTSMTQRWERELSTRPLTGKHWGVAITWHLLPSVSHRLLLPHFYFSISIVRAAPIHTTTLLSDQTTPGSNIFCIQF